MIEVFVAERQKAMRRGASAASDVDKGQCMLDADAKRELDRN